MKTILKVISVLSILLVAACNQTITPEDKPAPVQFKVISFNIRTPNGDAASPGYEWDNRKEGCVAMIKDQNPLVFGLQEAVKTQITYLDDNLSAYSWIGVGREDGKSDGEHMAVFYKKDEVTLGNWGTFWLSATPDTPSWGWGASYKRCTTWAFFTHKESGKKFLFLNTHFDHQDQTVRKKSADLMADKVMELREDGVPIILTGDFNESNIGTVFASLHTVMKNVRPYATHDKTDYEYTYHGYGTKGSMIDHIYATSDIEIVEFKTVQTEYGKVKYISDHYPIYAIFEY